MIWEVVGGLLLFVVYGCGILLVVVWALAIEDHLGRIANALESRKETEP